MALGNHEPSSTPPSSGARTAKLIAAGVLILIPIVALLAVPTYAKDSPRLWGFPFFFWYQFLWVFICSGMTYAAYRLVLSANRERAGR
ncbi:DUF3311 domain-containing protein [Nocardioides sp. Kera G14]|uniref:DUF3311 domain-containing protein n=1 Tax=Nocardioides sp. Kera G14 TaxID=2884264 RepID=UPI001D0FE41C|nr:DUF3311 domain-containing protein [Nocardioides sp. Kera G14]UDY23790.1 DUF3311 domain-containing protein [Nocardioides sp. Kera G14]